MLVEKLEGTEFELILIDKTKSIISEHMKMCFNDSSLNYEELGNVTEIKLKSILKYFSNIYSVLDDIDLSLSFLHKEREDILEDYSFLNKQEDYYKYHFENFYIRLITLADLCAKIGVLVYVFQIDLSRVSIFTFKDKAEKAGKYEISKISEELKSSIKKLKDARNDKLHNGVTDIQLFQEVVIWEDYESFVPNITNDTLTLYTNEQVQNTIKKLNLEAVNLVQIIKRFLNELTEPLKEITIANKV